MIVDVQKHLKAFVCFHYQQRMLSGQICGHALASACRHTHTHCGTAKPGLERLSRCNYSQARSLSVVMWLCTWFPTTNTAAMQTCFLWSIKTTTTTTVATTRKSNKKQSKQVTRPFSRLVVVFIVFVSWLPLTQYTDATTMNVVVAGLGWVRRYLRNKENSTKRHSDRATERQATHCSFKCTWIKHERNEIENKIWQWPAYNIIIIINMIIIVDTAIEVMQRERERSSSVALKYLLHCQVL